MLYFYTVTMCERNGSLESYVLEAADDTHAAREAAAALGGDGEAVCVKVERGEACGY